MNVPFNRRPFFSVHCSPIIPSAVKQTGLNAQRNSEKKNIRGERERQNDVLFSPHYCSFRIPSFYPFHTAQADRAKMGTGKENKDDVTSPPIHVDSSSCGRATRKDLLPQASTPYEIHMKSLISKHLLDRVCSSRLYSKSYLSGPFLSRNAQNPAAGLIIYSAL